MNFLNDLKIRGLINNTYSSVSNSWCYFNEFVLIKQKIKTIFLEELAQPWIVNCETPILTPKQNLQYSEHIKNFNEFYAICSICKGKKNSKEITCCGLTLKFDLFQNEMFKIEDNTLFLRPQTCVGLFACVSYLDYFFRQKSLFGLLQIGKSFRKEYSSNNKLFRLKEFEQIELELILNNKFYKPLDKIEMNLKFNYEDKIVDLTFFEKTDFSSEQSYNCFLYFFAKFLKILDGFQLQWKLVKIPEKDLPHYSKLSFDILAKFQDKQIELATLSDRGNFDLTHYLKLDTLSQRSVIEFSFGLERLTYCVLEKYIKNEKETFYLKDCKENAVIIKEKNLAVPYDILVFNSNTSLNINEISYLKNVFIEQDKKKFIHKANYSSIIVNLDIIQKMDQKEQFFESILKDINLLEEYKYKIGVIFKLLKSKNS